MPFAQTNVTVGEELLRHLDANLLYEGVNVSTRASLKDRIEAAKEIQRRKEVRFSERMIGEPANKMTKDLMSSVLRHEWSATLRSLNIDHNAMVIPRTEALFIRDDLTAHTLKIDYPAKVEIDERGVVQISQPVITTISDFDRLVQEKNDEVLKILEHDRRVEYRARVKSNLLIKVRSRNDPLRQNVEPAELQARYMLRDMLTEAEWRRYVTNGFLMVKGKSGKFYQIWAKQKHLSVYDKGKKTHELCIHTDNICPPTDHVINMKLTVETDETLLWKGGANIFKANGQREIPNLWPDDLLNEFQEFVRLPVERRA